MSASELSDTTSSEEEKSPPPAAKPPAPAVQTPAQIEIPSLPETSRAAVNDLFAYPVAEVAVTYAGKMATKPLKRTKILHDAVQKWEAAAIVDCATALEPKRAIVAGQHFAHAVHAVGLAAAYVMGSDTIGEETLKIFDQHFAGFTEIALGDRGRAVTTIEFLEKQFGMPSVESVEKALKIDRVSNESNLSKYRAAMENYKKKIADAAGASAAAEAVLAAAAAAGAGAAGAAGSGRATKKRARDGGVAHAAHAGESSGVTRERADAHAASVHRILTKAAARCWSPLATSLERGATKANQVAKEYAGGLINSWAQCLLPEPRRVGEAGMGRSPLNAVCFAPRFVAALMPTVAPAAREHHIAALAEAIAPVGTHARREHAAITATLQSWAQVVSEPSQEQLQMWVRSMLLHSAKGFPNADVSPLVGTPLVQDVYDWCCRASVWCYTQELGHVLRSNHQTVADVFSLIRKAPLPTPPAPAPKAGGAVAGARFQYSQPPQRYRPAPPSQQAWTPPLFAPTPPPPAGLPPRPAFPASGWSPAPAIPPLAGGGRPGGPGPRPGSTAQDWAEARSRAHGWASALTDAQWTALATHFGPRPPPFPVIRSQCHTMGFI